MPPTFTPGIDTDMHPLNFFRKFNSAKFLFEEFFDVMAIYKFFKVFKITIVSYTLIEYAAGIL